MKKFHIVRSNDSDNFLLVGEVMAATEAEAFLKGVEVGLITRRGSFLAVWSPPDPRFRTHKIQPDGTVRFLEMPLASAFD